MAYLRLRVGGALVLASICLDNDREARIERTAECRAIHHRDIPPIPSEGEGWRVVAADADPFSVRPGFW